MACSLGGCLAALVVGLDSQTVSGATYCGQAPTWNRPCAEMHTADRVPARTAISWHLSAAGAGTRAAHGQAQPGRPPLGYRASTCPAWLNRVPRSAAAALRSCDVVVGPARRCPRFPRTGPRRALWSSLSRPVGTAAWNASAGLRICFGSAEEFCISAHVVCVVGSWPREKRLPRFGHLTSRGHWWATAGGPKE